MGLLILGIAGRGGVIQANVLSPMDMLVVGIIAIMLFGNRLPEVARSLGRSMSEFKKGMQDVESEVETSLTGCAATTLVPGLKNRDWQRQLSQGTAEKLQ